MRGFGVLLQFGALALAWGSSFLFMKLGLAGLSPGQIVLARMVIGALTLGLVLVGTRTRPVGSAVLCGHLVVVAVFLCVLPFCLFSYAEQDIPSGLASMFNAATPLCTLGFAAAIFRTERLTGPRVAGLLLGLAGVALLIGPWSLSGGGAPLAKLACLGATVSYGLGFTYLRRFVAGRGVPAMTVAFIQVTAGALIMLLLSPVLASTPVRLSPSVVLSMLALGVFGTALAYVWNTNVVTAWGASNASAVTYLTPVVGVLLGVLVLGEPLRWNQPLGAVVVLLGIFTAHGGMSRHTRESVRPRRTIRRC